mgnify:FL=1
MGRALSMLMLIAVSAFFATGCGPSLGPQAQKGITFYCPGAGNIDFGDAGIREGLSAAGYEGQVASVLWTVSFNPAVDQTLRLNARLAAARLARAIDTYQDQYPGRPVNVIGLSAGTGVAIWAVESLPQGHSVDNVILLSSSLSSDYDLSKALPKVKGKIYNYYSPEDSILTGPMKLFGTIDGRYFVDGAGAVGLHPPGGGDSVVNIGWRQEFARYGYYGGHTDVTSPAFVRAEISGRVTGMPRGTARTDFARPVARALRDASAD